MQTMRKRREARGSIVDRMREQMAMKQLRHQARQRGLSVDDYLAHMEEDRRRREDTERINRLSETLAARIAERVKVTVQAMPAGQGAPEEEPKPVERIPFDDLQGIVDHLLQQKAKP